MTEQHGSRRLCVQWTPAGFESMEENVDCVYWDLLLILDIYNRMLRFKNYLVAMVNKSVLQTKFDVPCIGK